MHTTHKFQHLLSVGRLGPCHYQPHHRCHHQINNGVIWVGRTALRCVELVEKRAQHTALGRAGAESPGGGEVKTQFHLLGSVDKEVLNPGGGGWWKPQVGLLGDKNVHYYCVKCPL